MEIAVLIKPVPEAETRLRARADGTQLDVDGVKFVLAGYDESAIEQALLLREATPGSKVRALAFGPAPRTEEILRAALALGVDEATWVESPTEGADDPGIVARALAFALARIPHELLLGGKQAGDDEEGLVTAAIAESLGMADFGAVVNLRVDPASGSLTFQRTAEEGVESWTAPLPCAIALQQAWNDPRTAKLPNILKSRKMPIAKISWTEVSAALGEAVRPRSVAERFELPPARTGAKMIEYKSPDEAAEALVRILREEAKVFP
jgi:electron transfer flavoprotein beta subunit